MKEQTDFDLIIIGAGAAGYTASIYASRYSLRNLVIGMMKGGQASEIHKICNFPGFNELLGSELVERFHKHAEEMGGTVLFDKVTGIEGHFGRFTVTTETGKSFTSKTLLLAHGSRRRILNLPNESKLLGKGIAYCSTCDGPLFRGKTVAVVGGSDSADTSALYLSEIANHVFQIYRGSKLKGEPAWVNKILQNPKITVVLNTNVVEANGTNQLESITLDKEYNGSRELKVDGLFIEIGSQPDTTLPALIGVATDENGFVIVNSAQATNIPGVWAAGDATTGSNKFRQVITAAAEGAVAAENIFQTMQR